jgi:integrase
MCRFNASTPMAKALTPITVANLRARPHRYEISDGGCAGLRIVVFPSRRKSFIVRFRYRGLQRKLTLGPVLLTHNGEGEPDTTPEIDTPLSLAAARELATKALRQAKSGTDPAAAKQRRRQEQLAAESDTLEAIAEEYLRREGPQLRTISQRKADLDLLCASVLGRLPVAEIKRGQYTRVLDHIADHNGPVRADRVLSALKTLLAWHAERSDYVSVLGRGGRRTSIAERARSRVLNDDELKRVVETAEAEQRKGNPFGGFTLLVLYTATRRGEAAGLRRSELSDGGKTWVIPGSRYKSKRDTLIPLSTAAQRIVAAQPVLGDYVFSADGSRPLGGFDDRKTDFDKLAGVSGYTLHDLRRTSRTLLSRAGVAADIGERCLGHAMVGVRGTYDRHSFETEKRHAFEALAQQIERIVRPPAPVVADISVARGKRRRP